MSTNVPSIEISEGTKIASPPLCLFAFRYYIPHFLTRLKKRLLFLLFNVMLAFVDVCYVVHDIVC